MEMNGGSSAPYLACTPCVLLFCTLFNGDGNRRAFRLPGAGGDHFHCTVEPSPGHIRGRIRIRNQEKGGVLAKVVSAESSVTPERTENTQGYWAQQYI